MNTAYWNGNETKIGDISIHIPTVKEIKGNSPDIFSTEEEQEYYKILGLFAETPASQMVELDNAGINYETLSDYEIFLQLYQSFNKELLAKKSHLFFNNIRFSDLELSVDPEDGKFVLFNRLSGTVINEKIYNQLSKIFCEINCVEKKRCKTASETARKYFIQQERIRQALALKRRKPYVSVLNNYIVALVNNVNFKYDYNTVGNLTIAQLNLSLFQILKTKQVDNLSFGIYSGSVSGDKIDPDKLDWLNINT